MNLQHSKRPWFWLVRASLALTLISTTQLTLHARARPELIIATPPASAPMTPLENPLINPGFEDDWLHSPCDRYDGYGNFVDQINPGEIFTPEGWITFFKNGLPVQHDSSNHVGWAQPEVKVINNEPPFVDPPRIHSGEHALQLFTFWRIHDAGLYQQVNVTPGECWRLSAWVHAWTSEDDNPYHSQCDTWQAWQMVGIDPIGGTNPYTASVVWSVPNNIYDVYTHTHSVAVTTQANTITIFIRSWVKWPIIHNDMYWDNVSLELVTFSNTIYLPLVAKAWRNISTAPPTPTPLPTSANERASFDIVFVNPAEPGLVNVMTTVAPAPQYPPHP